MFENRRSIELPADLPPQLIAVVDTEEEFDWRAEPDSAADRVTAMDRIDRVQDVFDEYGITPCYVIDYPIASKPGGYRKLKAYVEEGRCEIGAHLHPWVNPPVSEALTRANTYPGNLPAELERQKLSLLRDTIQQNLGVLPVAYKAGRYGFGPNTGRTLQELGFHIDLSICPPLDSRSDGGPDYRRFDAWPFWFGEGDNPMLELPCTGGFVGWSGRAALPVYEAGLALKKFRAPGVLSRVGAVDRLMLSPEGFTTGEHIRLVRALYRQGLRSFTWSFHSPSVVPGNTEYVQDDEQLTDFIDRFRRFFDFFFNELGGQATTPTGLHRLIRENRL